MNEIVLSDFELTQPQEQMLRAVVQGEVYEVVRTGLFANTRFASCQVEVRQVHSDASTSFCSISIEKLGVGAGRELVAVQRSGVDS